MPAAIGWRHFLAPLFFFLFICLIKGYKIFYAVNVLGNAHRVAGVPTNSRDS
jgi:hypothetical protein